MNISGVPKIALNSAAGKGLKSRLFGLLPNITINKYKGLERLGTTIARPDVGRAILGATALCTQPFIDFYNRRVDEETAGVSTCRTIAKIIACSGVGIAVRWSSLKLVNLFTNLSKTAPKWKKWLLPSEKIQQILSAKNVDWIKNHRSTIGSIVALGAMLATNVLLDVPLTNYLSNKLLAKRDNIKAQKAERTGA